MRSSSHWFFRFVLCILLAGAWTIKGSAQPFIEEIQAFKKQDSLSFPPKQSILFVGSSSFRLWSDVNEFFPGLPIVNRGFGGSSLPDVLRYADDIIFPYQPKQVVIYCGENDIADHAAAATEVLSRFTDLFTLLRRRLPEANILFISMKPCPSRYALMQRVDSANQMIRDFLADKPNTSYVDVFHLMLNAQGRPDPELFLDDRLHMNRRGYFIWKKAIEPYLLK